jgi:HAD superfamily hydrolase (TIGR01509 family)
MNAGIEWGDINTVFLDMDGTLLDLHFDNYFWMTYLPEHYAKRHGQTIDQAREDLFQRFAAAEGSLDWYCLDYWQRELEVDIIALKQAVSHLIQVHEHVLDFLDQVRKAGKRLVLLTNAHHGSLKIKIEKTGIDGHFDRVITSHSLGLAKENRGFWEALREIEPYDKNHSMLVDDSLAVLRNARDFGIRHLIAVRWPDTRQDERVIEEFYSIRGVEALREGLSVVLP